jgi:hypothetical protein
MISTILKNHLKQITEYYPQIIAGNTLTDAESRPVLEQNLLRIIKEARMGLTGSISDLNRQRRIHVATGDPKGAWAHIYYISFHDPNNSNGPTEGYYPVFLVSVDQKICWLSVCLAAASENISGRGGWSQAKGQKLRDKASRLGRVVQKNDGWVKGPIRLGANSTFLYEEAGTLKSTGRAYESGAIISKSFDPKNPPDNLDEWLLQAFECYDEIFSTSSSYVEISMPHAKEKDIFEQKNAAILGAEAEKYFMDWVPKNHPEWGAAIDHTDKVGAGYDIEFPECHYKVEVKGCRKGLDDIRLTNREWEVAKKEKDKYKLVIVSHLHDDFPPKVDIISNPYFKLSECARSRKIWQITYTISRANLQEEIKDARGH